MTEIPMQAKKSRKRRVLTSGWSNYPFVQVETEFNFHSIQDIEELLRAHGILAKDRDRPELVGRFLWAAGTLVRDLKLHETAPRLKDLMAGLQNVARLSHDLHQLHRNRHASFEDLVRVETLSRTLAALLFGADDYLLATLRGRWLFGFFDPDLIDIVFDKDSRTWTRQLELARLDDLPKYTATDPARRSRSEWVLQLRALAAEALTRQHELKGEIYSPSPTARRDKVAVKLWARSEWVQRLGALASIAETRIVLANAAFNTKSRKRADPGGRANLYTMINAHPMWAFAHECFDLKFPDGLSSPGKSKYGFYPKRGDAQKFKDFFLISCEMVTGDKRESLWRTYGERLFTLRKKDQKLVDEIDEIGVALDNASFNTARSRKLYDQLVQKQQKRDIIKLRLSKDPDYLRALRRFRLKHG